MHEHGTDHDVRSQSDADRAMALLRPAIEALIADATISPEGALAVVVADTSRPEVPFDDAVLGRYAFGRIGRCELDYERHALDKARASHRERCDTSVLRGNASALLTADLPFAGGVHRRGWSIGVSGAVPGFEEAIGAMASELLHAIVRHRVADAPPPKETLSR